MITRKTFKRYQNYQKEINIKQNLLHCDKNIRNIEYKYPLRFSIKMISTLLQKITPNL